MAEDSGIAWTKSTFNGWIGCTNVGPGCENCYAEALDSRQRWGGRKHWGPNVERHRTSAAYWKNPHKWNKEAPSTKFAGVKGFWPVFCSSLADVFDNEAPQQWHDDLFELMYDTPNLTWLVVTKRIGNAARMLPGDWGTGYPNVWLLSTLVNQEEVDRDLAKLLTIPAARHGVSYEPALGPVDWCTSLHNAYAEIATTQRLAPGNHALDWVIIGGESTQNAPARPFQYEWAQTTIEHCYRSDVTPFMKQVGAQCYMQDGKRLMTPRARKDGANPFDWPHAIRVREFPVFDAHGNAASLITEAMRTHEGP